MRDLFRPESIGNPLCYIWDVKWCEWEPPAKGTRPIRVVDDTARDLSHALIRYHFHNLVERVSEANGTIPSGFFMESTTTYDSRMSKAVYRLFGWDVVSKAAQQWLDSNGTFHVDPIELLAPYERLFGVEMWILEGRKPSRSELWNRYREMLTGYDGTFEVIGFSRLDETRFADSMWRVRCSCGTLWDRSGASLIDGTYEPCGVKRHIEQLIANGDLDPSHVKAYESTPAAQNKIHDRDYHLEVVATTHPMIGRKFGDWEVIRWHGRKESTRYLYWLCQCKCGSEPRPVRLNSLLNGESQSCGNCHAAPVSHAFHMVFANAATEFAHTKGTSARETPVTHPNEPASEAERHDSHRYERQEFEHNQRNQLTNQPRNDFWQDRFWDGFEGESDER